MARRSKALTIHRGDDYPHTVTFTDGEGEPLDCSAWTVTSQIRATATASEPLASFDVDATDAATGVFTLNLTAEETRDLPTGNLTSDIQRTLAGKTTTILSCPVLVVEDVTRG